MRRSRVVRYDPLLAAETKPPPDFAPGRPLTSNPSPVSVKRQIPTGGGMRRRSERAITALATWTCVRAQPEFWLCQERR
jgi:hypothetical protein